MKTIKFSIGIPPLVLIGTVIVLFPIFAFMTIDRINRQEAQSLKLLVEKGTALIRSFEAGTYTGMMDTNWTRLAMENLLAETAALPDISYLFIVNKEGIVLVHNQKEKEGGLYGRELDLQNLIAENKVAWRIKKTHQGNRVFEVYKKFSPKNGERSTGEAMGMSMHQRMHAHAFRHADTFKDTVIFIGLDMTLITSADKDDTQHAIMMGIILALIGLTGFILVFIVQRYSQARSSLSRIQIFSDNLVENMPVGLIATDINSQVISVNPAAVSILKVQPAPQGRDFVLPEEIKHLLKTISEKKSPIEKELKLKGRTKSEIILEAIASPLQDKDGQSLGGLLILRDKTELHRLKNEMEQNRRLAAIGRLAAGVAHEIRNPLSSLKGYATFFKEIFDPVSENFTIADTMTKEVDRLNRVVGELVELARPIVVSSDPVNIEAIVLEITQLITYEPDAGHIDIRTDIESGLPHIYADPDRIKQMMLNLCLNALQSMEDSGKLNIQLQKEGENLTIKISDTGCGIKTEDLPDIFEPYFTTKPSGTGLGLSIVHNIVKAHKGRVSVESKPGKGTVFAIFLPIRMA